MSAAQLVLTLRPGVHALLSVVSVLHARAADVQSLDYTTEGDTAVLLVRLRASEPAAVRLATQLRRRIDVTEVSFAAG